MRKLSLGVTHVSEQAGEARALITEAGKLAATGTVAVVRTIGDINEIATVVDGSAGLAQELRAQIGLISAVVQTICEIADPTNQLALISAIEAARAGEQGRGWQFR